MIKTPLVGLTTASAREQAGSTSPDCQRRLQHSLLLVLVHGTDYLPQADTRLAFSFFAAFNALARAFPFLWLAAFAAFL